MSLRECPFHHINPSEIVVIMTNYWAITRRQAQFSALKWFHSFSTYLMNPYYVPSTLLGTGDEQKKQELLPCER